MNWNLLFYPPFIAFPRQVPGKSALYTPAKDQNVHSQTCKLSETQGRRKRIALSQRMRRENPKAT